jgi:hypothetical protein
MKSPPGGSACPEKKSKTVMAVTAIRFRFPASYSHEGQAPYEPSTSKLPRQHPDPSPSPMLAGVSFFDCCAIAPVLEEETPQVCNAGGHESEWRYQRRLRYARTVMILTHRHPMSACSANDRLALSHPMSMTVLATL